MERPVGLLERRLGKVVCVFQLVAVGEGQTLFLNERGSKKAVRMDCM
jgi:hypothetical protein